ncbi:hypothetical protein [Pedobacter sp.]|uniref:hypothetical protein n=1 Tax=Pedobacter sp. TaxID=1411316 RepID=UPI003D7F51E9
MIFRNILFPLLAITMLFAACQQQPKTEAQQQLNTSDSSNASVHKACYSFMKNRDTVTLTLEQRGKAYSGELRYQLYEKDSNEGKVSGKMMGDTLLLNYTFNSEGTSSVRQIAFLKKNNQLLEGYGPVVDKEGAVVFKNTSDLKFGDGIVLETVDCP